MKFEYDFDKAFASRFDAMLQKTLDSADEYRKENPDLPVENIIGYHSVRLVRDAMDLTKDVLEDYHAQLTSHLEKKL